MSVAVAWCATRGFHVKITHQDTTHNHTLESGSYGNHPSVRRVQDEDVIDFVDELQAAGVKKKLMLQFLMKKTDKHVSHSWGHLEEVLKPSMPLDECVDPLQFLQSVAEMDYAKKMTDVGYMCYACADTETQKLAREVSQHAYQSVEKQYRVANDQKTEYTTREIQPHMIEMVSTVDTTRKYHLDTRTYHCSCIFVKTELLPYMHAIYWRLLANKSPIPIKNIYRRWDLTCPLNTPVEDEEDTEGEAAYTSF
ncbi:hypothetical protein PC113_g22042 [Phytophthora cactorum]|uniref:Uncharacterized protein n=2 Tax=Phytophthora cactorum TaxID=29920 RepID=A0A8T0Y6Q5_9STRA|nr:hypothetical protein PC113_g22042 [Phytophthora cactorum]